MKTTNRTAIDALTPEQIFEIAAPYFDWNAPNWQKATQGLIGMPNLLSYSRALLDALAPTVQDAEPTPLVTLACGCGWQDEDTGDWTFTEKNLTRFAERIRTERAATQPAGEAVPYIPDAHLKGGLCTSVLNVMYKACQRGDSVERMHAAVMAIIDAVPTPQAAPTVQGSVDERVAFEQSEIAYWQSKQDHPLTDAEKKYLLRPANSILAAGGSTYDACEQRWQGWQARAALAQRAAVAEVASINVVADVIEKLMGEMCIEWCNPGPDHEGGDDGGFNSNEEERAYLCSLIRKVIAPTASTPPAPVQSAASEWTEEDQQEQDYFDRHPDIAPAPSEPVPQGVLPMQSGIPGQVRVLTGKTPGWQSAPTATSGGEAAERAAFEQWACPALGSAAVDEKGFYSEPRVWTAWCAWAARTRLAPPSLPATDAASVLEEINEGDEILSNFIDSVERHGNYSREATITFLGQVRQSFSAIRALISKGA